MRFHSQFFEDHEIAARRETPGRTITEAGLVIHATQPFGQKIAHGTLAFSVGIGLMAGGANPEAISKGYGRLRLVQPVFVGDTLRSVASIVRKEEGKRPEPLPVVQRRRMKHGP